MLQDKGSDGLAEAIKTLKEAQERYDANEA